MLGTLPNTPWPNSHPSPNLGDSSKPRAGATNTSIHISTPNSTCISPGLFFLSLLLFLLISSHLPKKGLAEASLRAYKQSMAAGNAFNNLMLAQVSQVLSLECNWCFPPRKGTQKQNNPGEKGSDRVMPLRAGQEQQQEAGGVGGIQSSSGLVSQHLQRNELSWSAGTPSSVPICVVCHIWALKPYSL